MNIQQPLTSFEQWRLVKALGSGAFGEVHYWINNENGNEIATKRLKPNPKLKQDEISILHKRWLQEYKWMKNLHTNFIVGAIQINDSNFLNYLAGQHDADLSLPVIVMEYCNGGDLRDHLNKLINLNGLQEYEVRAILFALVRATEYLHNECNIEHRDIKPENIVVQTKGNEKMYKLTDFGYAREIPESTIAQSVVGTRNYVAPEVIDPGLYTKTVDYWSIGILTYEIICGTQPFIPHQTLFNRMKNITCKPSHCIAIVQSIDDLSTERFEFLNKILPRNHMSCIFLSEMEKWLYMALNTNYKTRGCDSNNQLKFYSDLDNLVQKKIVTVFSLKTLKKYYYDIQCYQNLTSFYSKICLDNNIDDITKIFFILPPLHPKKFPQHPLDYFVSDWCDTTNPDNPPVMLFVTEYFIQNNCDIDEGKHFKITETIQKCLCMNAEGDYMENFKWLLKQFERDVHFILSERQHLLECYLMGLKNFSIEIEHAVSTYKDLETLSQNINQLNGGVKHCHVVLNEYININKEKTEKELEIAKMFTFKCQELQRFTEFQLKASHKEIVHKCRELALNSIFEEYAKSDIFELSKYRKFLSLSHSAAERLSRTQLVFDNAIREFVKFTQNSAIKEVRSDLLDQIQKFVYIRQKVIEISQIILHLESDVENFTRSLIKNIINDTLAQGRNLLHSYGPITPSNSLINNHSSVKDFEMDSQQLIDECQTLCNAMEMTLEIN